MMKIDGLPLVARYGEVTGLALMTITVGLLIAPGPYHRLVYGGRDDPSLLPVITAFAAGALLPFGFALGIALYIAMERGFGTMPGLAAGCAAAALALGAWYGLPYGAKAVRKKGRQQWRPEEERKHRSRFALSRC